MTYRIKDWNDRFENNRTRELKELRFVIVPNKQDGDGYTELLDHPNGPAHYAAWIAILQVTSKGAHPAGGCGISAGCCECRGILLREGARPHDPMSLSRLTRIPASIYEEVLPRLVGIGWLQSETQQNQPDRTIPHDAGTNPAQSRTPLRESATPIEEKRREGNGIEENGKEEARTPRAPSSRTKLCDEAFLSDLQQDEAYKRLDVRLLHAKMLRWCKEKGKTATRARLINWLNREDQPMSNGQRPSPERPAWMASSK